MKFKISLILILVSFTGFSQIEPKIYICNSTNISKLHFEFDKGIYYFKPLKDTKECNVFFFNNSTIQLFNNDSIITWVVVQQHSLKDGGLRLISDLNGKESDFFTIYSDRIERESFDESVSINFKYTYENVTIKNICK